MRINNFRWKNINSYGNKLQTIKTKPEGSLNLIVGDNGSGKCVHPDTEIELNFGNPELEKKFMDFVNKNK